MLSSSEMGLTLQTIVRAFILGDGPDTTNNCQLSAGAFSERRAERVKKGLKDEKDGRQSCSDCSRKKIPSPWRCKEQGCVRKDKLSTEAVSEWIAERVDKGQKAEGNGRQS